MFIVRMPGMIMAVFGTVVVPQLGQQFAAGESLMQGVVVVAHHFHLGGHGAEIDEATVDVAGAFADDGFHTPDFFFYGKFSVGGDALHGFLEGGIDVEAIVTKIKRFKAEGFGLVRR